VGPKYQEQFSQSFDFAQGRFAGANLLRIVKSCREQFL